MIERKCLSCGKIFLVSRIRKDRPKSGCYCSVECRHDGLRLKDVPWGEIKARFLAGEPALRLEKIYGVSRPAICRNLRRMGVDTNRQKPPGPMSREGLRNLRAAAKERTGEGHWRFIDLPITDIIASYLAGDTSAVIAARYDVSQGTILKRLRDAHVQRRRSSFGKISTAKDGHLVYSTLERIVDDWLFDRGILHQTQPPCPWDTGSAYSQRADFLVGDHYVEVWGMEKNAKYNQKKQQKIALYEKYGLKLVGLLPEQVLADDWSPLESFLYP